MVQDCQQNKSTRSTQCNNPTLNSTSQGTYITNLPLSSLPKQPGGVSKLFSVFRQWNTREQWCWLMGTDRVLVLQPILFFKSAKLVSRNGEWKKAIEVRPGCVVDDDENWRIHRFQGYVDGWAAVQVVLGFPPKEDSEDSCDRKIQMMQTPTSVWLRQLQQRG
uniref:Uncharacterized protein n=1 Tax=Vitis vinifera TaxID=29760 RepID=A5AXX0_VITVI|nr:hypothetical protein VITISV_003410 [Vitis vinifera]